MHKLNLTHNSIQTFYAFAFDTIYEHSVNITVCVIAHFKTASIIGRMS